MFNNDVVILGAGITGLAAGLKSGKEIYEATTHAGGLCASYYIDPTGKKYPYRKTDDSYRFEIGGGHWIFGANNKILNFINSFSQVKLYKRNSAVYFPSHDLYVPYPIQYHLSHFPEIIAKKSIDEIFHTKERQTKTLADWLEVNFGKTLCEFFFFPYHKLYTAGLYTQITPEDKFKTPADRTLIIKGLNEKIPPAGYNVTFVYPENGLDDLIRNISKRLKINCKKKIVKIDIKSKKIIFEDGRRIRYEKIISTLPLNKVVEMSNLEFDESPPPYTSAAVFNIGAKKGKKCPCYHWVYVPNSKSEFHRVGFYSNVERSFLPLNSMKDNSRVSIYVEKIYKGGKQPDKNTLKKISYQIIKELQEWKFIDEVEVIDATWIEVAYTWNYPDSKWRQKALQILHKHNIYVVGRYGKWQFQGIADSIKDGLTIGKNL